MKTLGILDSQLSALKLDDPKCVYKIENAFFKIRNLWTEKKTEEINFKKDSVAALIQSILANIQKAFSSNSFPFTKLSYNEKTISSVELNLLQYFSLLEWPMDFPFTTLSKKSLFLHDIITLLCNRADAFLKSKQDDDISPETFTFTLNALTKINLNASLPLKQSSRKLINTLFDKAIINLDKGKFNTENKIYLLWNAAIHSLVDNQYVPIISWEKTKIILNEIENATGASQNLNAFLARALFQVYAANYSHCAEFPVKLLEKMRSYIPTFQQTTHSSNFENTVQDYSKFYNGFLSTLTQNYSYIAWENLFNFKNPITFFGLETDISFSYPSEKIYLAIQIDGNKYHTFPDFNPTINQKTLFRNFCFKQTGIPQMEITQINQTGDVLNFVKENAIIPIHRSLQDKYLRLFDSMKKSLNDKKNELDKQLNNILGTEGGFEKKMAKLTPMVSQLITQAKNLNYPEILDCIAISGKLKEIHNSANKAILLDIQKVLNNLFPMFSVLETEIEQFSTFLNTVNIGSELRKIMHTISIAEARKQKLLGMLSVKNSTSKRKKSKSELSSSLAKCDNKIPHWELSSSLKGLTSSINDSVSSSNGLASSNNGLASSNNDLASSSNSLTSSNGLVLSNYLVSFAEQNFLDTISSQSTPENELEKINMEFPKLLYKKNKLENLLQIENISELFCSKFRATHADLLSQINRLESSFKLAQENLLQEFTAIEHEILKIQQILDGIEIVKNNLLKQREDLIGKYKLKKREVGWTLLTYDKEIKKAPHLFEKHRSTLEQAANILSQPEIKTNLLWNLKSC